jgi:CCR4-NOT transcription complex subunit 9
MDNLNSSFPSGLLSSGASVGSSNNKFGGSMGTSNSNSFNLGMSLGVVGGSGAGASSSNTGTGTSMNPQQQAQSSNMFNMSMTGGTNPNQMASSSGGGGSSNNNANAQSTIDELLPLVMQLNNPDQREGVLLELSKKRESFNDLAPILWHTVGTVSALLQEIVSIYPLLSPPTLTAHASNRVCNALALLQCVASHQDTRSLFLAAHIPLYLYPFLNTQSKSRPFEYLRLTSLGVIGALVKMDDPDVINFLLQTEIIPLCLRIMESGSELSKTVATFIVQKILLDEVGLSYVCATAERFYAVSQVLNNMIGLLIQVPSVRLLKHIVRCYLRLSDNLRAREALKQCLPMSLRDDTFAKALRDDVTVKKWLSQLLNVVGPPVEGSGNVGMTGAPVGGGLNRFGN